MALSLSDYDAMLKEWYDGGKVQDLTHDADPFYEMVKKQEVEGDVIVTPFIYGNYMGRSADFTHAQANKRGGSYAKTTLGTADMFVTPSIAYKTIRASKGNKGAFIDAVTAEMDNAFRSLATDLSIALYRDGGGAIGRISTGSNVSTTTITLENVEDVENFEEGMQVTAHSASTGGTDRTGVHTITAVNRDTGELSTATAWDAGANDPVAGDYLKLEGDDDAKLKGLEAWIPATAPSSSGDLDGTLDRTKDTRLSGVRFDGSSMSVLEALLAGAARLGRGKGKPDAAFVSYKSWREVVTDLGAQKQFTSEKASAYFKGVEVIGPKGPISVFPSSHCANDVAWLLQMDTWSLKSLGGPAIGFFDEDNSGKLLREASAAAVEARIGGFVQLVCNAPGWNSRVALRES